MRQYLRILDGKNEVLAMWSTRPVFVSSTFQDMQAERDHLRNFVFPTLEERLRRLHQHLEWVDLRIGVTSASLADDQREEQVLTVCLTEARRCRPFMVVLLGDRYGWVPPNERMASAVAEAGFVADSAGRSVTDLEIELGVLSDEVLETRSLFYFRDPLPYAKLNPDAIAVYADEYNRGRLAALKSRIETALPDRVHHYAGTWDEAAGCVTGLDSWGRDVLDALWVELEAAAAPHASESDISWMQSDRNALEEFVEDRSRGFVGRKALLAQLSHDAQSLPNNTAASSRVCVTGAAGLGKSALFSTLYRKLRQQNVFVLAHAAGSNVRSRSVDAMLRRWIEELAIALRVDVTLSEGVNAESEVAGTFFTLLGQLADRERVVVLIDALDQFDLMSRGRFARWLPRNAHLNTRFVVTAVPGEASDALAERGFELLPLPPLDASDARGIVGEVCARYHRAFERETIEALLAKTGSAGFAWASPLWVVLAAETLNLVDADDFARASSFEGTPAERLRALMVNRVADLPSHIPALYGATFDHAMKLFGTRFVEAWLSLIAVGRGGWREGDFRVILPGLAGEEWDELRFAQLRRVFRGQVRQQGALGQWDFNHEQMRDAVRDRILNQNEAAVHAAVADHLLILQPDDPLRQSEAMVHLLGSQNWKRVIHYYGDDELTPAELQGATEVLADAALRPAHGVDETGLEQVFHLLEPGDADFGSFEYDEDLSYQEYAAERLLHHVLSSLHARATLDLREVFAKRLVDFFDRLWTDDPEVRARHDVQRGSARGFVGDIQASMGKLTEAEESFRGSALYFERLVRDYPNRVEWQRDLSVNHNHMGKLQVLRNDFAAAAASFDAAHALMQRVVCADPDKVEWERDLAITHIFIGDVSLREGEAAAAEVSYQAALAIHERLADQHPESSEYRADIAKVQNHVAHARAMRFDQSGAESSYRTALSICQGLVDQEPGNLDRLESLFVSLEGLGTIQERRGHWADAETSLQDAVAICERLVVRDDQNVHWQGGLSNNTLLLATVALERGDVGVAESATRRSLTVAERLARNDPGNQELQGDVARRYLMLGTVQIARGDLMEAERSCHSAQAIARQLEATPWSPWPRMTLALGHSLMGDIQLHRGDLTSAETSIRAGLAILAGLLNRDPDNGEILRNLAACYGALGELQRRSGDLAAAEESFGCEVALVERLAARDPDNVVLLRPVAGCYARLRDIQGERGDLAGAQKSYSKLRALEKHWEK